MKLTTFVFASLMTASVWAISPFEELDQQYTEGGMPDIKMVEGYWAGHCISPVNPTEKRPAILLAKHMKKQDGSEYYAITYFWEKKDDPTFFMNKKPSEIENYPPVKEWFQKEQWQPLVMEEGAAVNYYGLNDGSRIQRALRVFETEFAPNQVLRVSKVTGVGAEIINYCHYPKYLGKVNQSTSTDKPFNFYTGYVKNQWISITNPNPSQLLKEIVISKSSFGRVFLTKVEVTKTDGTVTLFGTIPIAGWQDIALKDQTSLSVKSLKFFVDGATPNLMIRGVKASSFEQEQE